MRDLLIILAAGTFIHLQHHPVLASPLPIKCPRVTSSNHPVYFAHVNKNMYYLCSGIGLLELFCGEGCTFSVQRQSCECSEQTHSARYIHSTSFPEATGSCPISNGLNNPIYLPHRNCAKYYLCTKNGAVERKCIDGFYWSVEANRCDRPWHARCAGSGAIEGRSELGPTIRPIRIAGTTAPSYTRIQNGNTMEDSAENDDDIYSTDHPAIQ